MVTGPLHFSWTQRFLSALGTTIVAYGVGYTIHRHNQKKAHTPQPAASSAKSEPQAPTTLPGGRILLSVGVEYLTGLYKGHTDLQADKLMEPFIGKWIKYSGRMENISQDHGSRPTTTITFEHSSRPFVAATFMSDEWLERLSILQRGAQITILGQVWSVERYWVFLSNSELVYSASN